MTSVTGFPMRRVFRFIRGSECRTWKISKRNESRFVNCCLWKTMHQFVKQMTPSVDHRVGTCVWRCKRELQKKKAIRQTVSVYGCQFWLPYQFPEKNLIQRWLCNFCRRISRSFKRHCPRLWWFSLEDNLREIVRKILKGVTFAPSGGRIMGKTDSKRKSHMQNFAIREIV